MCRFVCVSQVALSPGAIRRNSRKFSLPVAVMPGAPEMPSVGEAAGGNAGGKLSKEQYRVVVLGPPKVGKTAIITQFLYDRFVPHYKETSEELHRGEYNVAGCPLKLDIMDTSGSNEFPAMRDLSISNADGFILVYSVDRENSFEEVRQLRDLILSTRPENTPLVVVGNKCDVSDEKRQVERKTAETIVTIDWENGFVEASAKDNTNIVAVFKELLNQAKVPYALSPAVRKRRQSLPNYTPPPRLHGAKAVKRDCVIS
uniref:Uncharacterized protein n=1 Tax=Strigamia maritima TaxID=126957 RepID=T1ITV7_STRMM